MNEDVNQLKNYVTTNFTKRIIDVNEVVNKQVHDVTVKIYAASSLCSPAVWSVSWSHDVDAGYFIDIEGITYEYGANAKEFKADAMKFIEAILQGKALYSKSRLFGIIPGSIKIK